MFWCKIFQKKDHLVVAICDENILDKEIGNEYKIKIDKKFYGDKLVNDEKACELIKKSTIANLIGKKIIKLVLEKKFITKENIMFIGEIPHAQFVK